MADTASPEKRQEAAFGGQRPHEFDKKRRIGPLEASYLSSCVSSGVHSPLKSSDQ